MTEEEREYYQLLRRRYEDEQRIAKAVKWAIWLMVVGGVVCWVWFRAHGGSVKTLVISTDRRDL